MEAKLLNEHNRNMLYKLQQDILKCIQEVDALVDEKVPKEVKDAYIFYLP